MFVLALVGVSSSLVAQSLLGVESLGTITSDSLSSIFGIPVPQDIEVYRVEYSTTGTDGMPDTASGLFARPLDNVQGIVAYQHGTTGSRDVVPSNLNLADALIAMGYAGRGYMCAAADYLGLGTSRGFHPYVHAETQARAGLDMMLALRGGMGELGLEWPENIFVSGYSQGGHAAMALAQTLQERPTDDLWLNGSTPMSGPYALSSGTRDLILSEQEYDFVGYVIYIIRGYQEVYGDMYSSLEDIIKPTYLDEIVQFSSGEITLNELNAILVPKLRANEGGVFPKLLFEESYLREFTDTTSIPFQRLRENDTYRWIPDSPMRMYYCEADEQVPFVNSIIAEEYMVAGGAVDVKALNLSSTANHGTCAIFAVLSSIEFFDSLSIVSPVRNIVSTPSLTLVYPNPAVDFVQVKSDLPSGRLEVYNMAGTLVRDFGVRREIDITELPAGSYVARLVTSDQTISQLLIKR